ncbi:hypothetical protein EJ04DRAFT_520779 [Polyplosphaeria fusca]|uniref:Uncharacterized protein n=1 Tax=Polyplosphaeria fusca TaxID=682080 RepID=A0A9P4R761_9PLEO|nr:hypothetical protein EJ04DRAFT_520779 [Polyplosphaeria fusca]
MSKKRRQHQSDVASGLGPGCVSVVGRRGFGALESEPEVRVEKPGGVGYRGRRPNSWSDAGRSGQVGLLTTPRPPSGSPSPASPSGPTLSGKHVASRNPANGAAVAINEEGIRYPHRTGSAHFPLPGHGPFCVDHCGREKSRMEQPGPKSAVLHFRRAIRTCTRPMAAAPRHILYAAHRDRAVTSCKLMFRDGPSHRQKAAWRRGTGRWVEQTLKCVSLDSSWALQKAPLGSAKVVGQERLDSFANANRKTARSTRDRGVGECSYPGSSLPRSSRTVMPALPEKIIAKRGVVPHAPGALLLWFHGMARSPCRRAEKVGRKPPIGKDHLSCLANAQEETSTMTERASVVDGGVARAMHDRIEKLSSSLAAKAYPHRNLHPAGVPSISHLHTANHAPKQQSGRQQRCSQPPTYRG